MPRERDFAGQIDAVLDKVLEQGAQDRTLIAMRRILDLMVVGKSVQASVKLAGLTTHTHYRWRNVYQPYKEFTDVIVASNKAAHVAAKKARKQVRLEDAGLVFDPDRPIPPKPDFVTFRWDYFGRPTRPDQMFIVRALEDRTNNTVIVLAPPGSGKDTIAGDWVAYILADDRGGRRVGWIMEGAEFSRRRLRRLLRYFTDPGVYKYQPEKTPGGQAPTRSLLDDYGPYRWEKGMVDLEGRKLDRPPWNSNQVYFLQSIAPEADPNLWATGIEGTLYGSRLDDVILSDIFTLENQQSPTVRAKQIDWLDGTFETRLDDMGRAVFIGTLLPIANNYEVLLDRLTDDAVILDQDGPYTKWSNGVATVIYKAIETDDQGDERSYWPDRFPLDSQLELDGHRWPLPGMSHDRLKELAKQGAKRVRGLREIRAKNPRMFQAMYQQERQSHESADFTDETIEAAYDRTRSFGRVLPGELLVLGVDPAKTYGAAWAMWAVNRDLETITLADFWYGERLGVSGIKQSLITAPITRYYPAWLCYETNRESAVLEDPHIRQVFTDFGTAVYEHHTGKARNDMRLGVPSLAFDMRNGQLRIPAGTPEDRTRLPLLKAQLQAWSDDPKRPKPGAPGHVPDDIAMAMWIGYIKARELLLRNVRADTLPRRVVPDAVLRRWEQHQARRAGERRRKDHEIVRDGIAHHTGEEILVEFVTGGGSQ